MSVTTRVISWRELAQFSSAQQPNFVVAVLLGGDRLTCCDEGVGIEVDGELVGVASIAPQGEEHSGVPTLVGMYILPVHRGQGHGKPLLEATIRRCKERDLAPIRVDAMSMRFMRIVQSLPEDLQTLLEVHDTGEEFYMDLVGGWDMM